MKDPHLIICSNAMVYIHMLYFIHQISMPYSYFLFCTLIYITCYIKPTSIHFTRAYLLLGPRGHRSLASNSKQITSLPSTQKQL